MPLPRPSLEELFGNSIVLFQGEYRWLSNFGAVEIYFDGELYPSVEHAYQAAKTHNAEQRKQIRNATTPGKARRLGQEVDLRSDWESVKLSVMRRCLAQKFDPTVNSDYAAALLATGNRFLVEGNSWGDHFWGVHKGEGCNHLGRLLMDIRADLQRGINLQGQLF